MSSSEAQSLSVAVSRRTWLRAIVSAAVLGPALAACGSEAGFRPLYGSALTGGNVDQKMAQVRIAPIPSRVGQRVRNELIFQHTGGGAPPPPLYTLEIALTESLTSTLVKTSGEALSQVYNLYADFKLISISDKRVVLQGQSHARAGFERFQSIYSNVRAREDAENRAAKTLAEDLKGRIAARLSDRSA